VKDPTGAVIPGVSVVISNATNVSDPVKTDSEGRYVVNNLSPGSYEVEARAPGFDTQQTPVTLIASQQTALNFILSVGQVSQSVTVEAAASPSPSLPVVRKMIAKSPSPTRFEITTDTGEHWTSTDGQIWMHK
jgi:large repetitive protein